jgi:hypothetical protein
MGYGMDPAPHFKEDEMNRKFFAPALSVLLLGGIAAVGQDKAMEKTDQKTVTTDAGKTTAKTQTYLGTVKEFESGKSIKVLLGKKTRSFSLDSKTVATTVDPAVAVGSKVKVVQTTDANGNKTLTVNPAS